MAHLIESMGSETDKEMDVEENSDAQFACISHSRALVSPSEEEFELIVKKLNLLIAEGRGECIFEVGLSTDPSTVEESNGEHAEDAEAASGDKDKGQNRSGHSKPQKMMSRNQRKRDEEPTPSVPTATAAAATPVTTPK